MRITRWSTPALITLIKWGLRLCVSVHDRFGEFLGRNLILTRSDRRAEGFQSFWISHLLLVRG